MVLPGEEGAGQCLLLCWALSQLMRERLGHLRKDVSRKVHFQPSCTSLQPFCAQDVKFSPSGPFMSMGSELFQELLKDIGLGLSYIPPSSWETPGLDLTPQLCPVLPPDNPTRHGRVTCLGGDRVTIGPIIWSK